MFRVNDTVRVFAYPKGHMNAYARVTAVEPGFYRITNMNMPFCGTLANVLVRPHEIGYKTE